MGALNDDGVGPELIAGGGNHRNCKHLRAFRWGRLRESHCCTAIQKQGFERSVKEEFSVGSHANSPIKSLRTLNNPMHVMSASPKRTEMMRSVGMAGWSLSFSPLIAE